MTDAQSLAYVDYPDYRGLQVPPRANPRVQPKLYGWRTDPAAHAMRIHNVLTKRAHRSLNAGMDYAEFTGYVRPGREQKADELADLRKEFYAHVRKWTRDTQFVSSVYEMTVHPSYLRIIGMGRPALPWILAELQKRPGHWFSALYAITGANPIPSEDAGRIKKMTEHWIKWGKRQGFLLK